MSKRKNPLQNLDDFLKQEATSLVTPKKLSEPGHATSPAPEASVVSEPKPTIVKPADINNHHILELVQKLANKNNLSVKNQLIQLLRQQLEENGLQSSTDKMLINTLLIIEHGDNWKEKVGEYWDKHLS